MPAYENAEKLKIQSVEEILLQNSIGCILISTRHEFGIIKIINDIKHGN